MPPPLLDRVAPYLSCPTFGSFLTMQSHPRAEKVTVSSVIRGSDSIGQALEVSQTRRTHDTWDNYVLLP